jgi:hypothetical protein
VAHPPSDSLTDQERNTRDALLARSPLLRATRDQVSEFAEILSQRRGHEVSGWLKRVATDSAPALRSPPAWTGISAPSRRGLTLSYSSGPVEGRSTASR